MQPDSTKTRCLWTLIATAALLLVLMAQPALAVTKQWVGTPFNNLWTTASNWSPSGEPGAGDDVFVTQSGFFPKTVIYNTSSNPMLSALTVDATGWGNITLQQSGNALTADNETIGLDGKGVYDQSGGSNTVNTNPRSSQLILGYNPTGKGTYNLSGSGSLLASNEIIGSQGAGTFNQSGGTNTITQFLFLGGINSTYNLSGGSLSVAGPLAGNEYIGYSGTGTFNQFGGTHTASGLLYVGYDFGGIGTYNLKGGSLQAEGESIGTGTFNQTGGSNTVKGLELGSVRDALGTYNLVSGNLVVTDFNEYIGSFGSGIFNQSGGTHTVSTKNLFLGYFYRPTGSGTYNLKGGSLSVAGNEYIGNSGSGTFNQSGGTHTVGLDLTLGNEATGSGTYNLSKDGSLSVSGDEFIGYNGTGVFNQTGGTHTVAGILTLAAQFGSSGTYNLHRGTLKANDEMIGPVGTGVFNQNGGANIVTNSLTLSPLGGTGTYNLNGGILSAKTIDIDANDTFNVMNTITTVTGDVENYGTVNTTKAIVTWNGTFTNKGAYISDHATQTFTDLTVPDPVIQTGYLVGHSQDVFKIKNDFNNMSINASAWDTAAATLKFVTGADKSHNFYIPGEDKGPSGTNGFEWGTLIILGQTVHLFDGNDSNEGTAQYVGGLIGAKVNWFTKMVYNIFNDDDEEINIYYDPDLLINAYLLGKTYDFAGGLGQLKPDPTPVPPSVFLLGSGLLGLGLLGWRRKRSG